MRSAGVTDNTLARTTVFAGEHGTEQRHKQASSCQGKKVPTFRWTREQSILSCRVLLGWGDHETLSSVDSGLTHSHQQHGQPGKDCPARPGQSPGQQETHRPDRLCLGSPAPRSQGRQQPSDTRWVYTLRELLLQVSPQFQTGRHTRNQSRGPKERPACLRRNLCQCAAFPGWLATLRQPKSLWEARAREAELIPVSCHPSELGAPSQKYLWRQHFSCAGPITGQQGNVPVKTLVWACALLCGHHPRRCNTGPLSARAMDRWPSATSPSRLRDCRAHPRPPHT